MEKSITDTVKFNIPGQATETDHWFRNGKFANLLIACDNTTFSVHEDVIFSQSKVLKAACSGGFKESFTKTICLSDECHLVKRMIPFFYYGSYPDLINESVESNIKMHIDMYTMADKYEVPDLGNVALVKFRAYLSKIRHSTSEIDFIFECIRAVYGSTPHLKCGLRELVVNRIATEINSIKIHEDLCDSLHALILDIPDFAWDFVKNVAGIDPIQNMVTGVAASVGAVIEKRNMKKEKS